MLLSLFYKEWLKLRYVFFVPFLVTLVGLLMVYIDFSYVYRMTAPINLWLDTAIMGKIFYWDMRYVCALSGPWFALFQFVPEVTDKRLRLLFHLPVARRKSVYFMVGVGLSFLLLVCLVSLGGLVLIVSYYMPYEAVKSMVITVLPWLLAGFPMYLGTVIAVMERGWVYKFVHGICTLFFVDTLLSVSSHSGFALNFMWYALLCILWIFPIEHAAYRVKRGLAW